MRGLRDYIVALGDDAPVNELKLYVALKKVKNIICVEIYNKRLVVQMDLNPETVERIMRIEARSTWRMSCYTKPFAAFHTISNAQLLAKVVGSATRLELETGFKHDIKGIHNFHEAAEKLDCFIFSIERF